MKHCKKCGELKPMDLFYKHPNTLDGRGSGCIECAKQMVIANRRANADYYRAFDRARGKTTAHRAAYAEKSKRMRAEIPGFDKAHNDIYRAVRSGKVIRPGKCERCPATNRIQAHHDDHTKSFDIMWLCPICHAARHSELAAMRAAV